MRVRKRAKPNTSVPYARLTILAALVFVIYVRLRVADVPLERDEGEYAYAGQLILEGVPPYALAYNMKFPGTYYAYAAILALLGHTPSAIHVGLMIVNVVTILLVFAVGRRLLGEFAGSVAAVSFAILSLDRWVFGVFAHATHFVILAAMAGLLLLLRAIDDTRASSFVSAGALLGLSVLMKQHAIFLLPFGAALAYWGEIPDDVRSRMARAKSIAMLAAGTLIPLAAIVLILLWRGVLDRFWFWTFRYASAYVSENPLSVAWSNFVTGFVSVTAATALFWALGAIGLAALWITKWSRRARIALTGLFVASFLAICPGFYFREHYFILLLPAVALLVGVAIDGLKAAFARSTSLNAATFLAVGVLGIAVGVYVTNERDYLFTMGTRELSGTLFGTNPFLEAAEIGKYIKDHTDKNDRIAVLGSEPEIYFYADRKAATGYMYTYALMESQPFAKTMQAEMIKEIEAAHPKYFVYSKIDVSWMASPKSDQGIVHWGNRYLANCYDRVGIADVVTDTDRVVAWEAEARKYVVRSADLVFICRRKSDAACVAGP